MNCKICNHVTTPIFRKTILKKYAADYYQCEHCDFVQTSEPLWLQEAYASAITSLDIGLLSRNMHMMQAVPRMLDACFPNAKRMLDYAGGYGVFTRLMRDQGFQFYRQDIYCENIFAKQFDISDTDHATFDVATAFEVFEHFADPLPEIEKLFAYSSELIFSTELIPAGLQELRDWWYLSTETGQHIAFYSAKTMQYLAKKYNKNYYHKGNSLHVFTSRTFSNDQVNYAFKNQNYKELFGLLKVPYRFKVNRPSLLEADYNYIKSLL